MSNWSRTIHAKLQLRFSADVGTGRITVGYDTKQTITIANGFGEYRISAALDQLRPCVVICGFGSATVCSGLSLVDDLPTVLTLVSTNRM
jgi:hypothetical protein